jgi:hypothetical protein
MRPLGFRKTKTFDDQVKASRARENRGQVPEFWSDRFGHIMEGSLWSFEDCEIRNGVCGLSQEMFLYDSCETWGSFDSISDHLSWHEDFSGRVLTRECEAEFDFSDDPITCSELPPSESML